MMNGGARRTQVCVRHRPPISFDVNEARLSGGVESPARYGDNRSTVLISPYSNGMSSRITSELGTLGDRIARMRATEPARTVRHVLARDDAGLWQPALLVAWFRAQDRWWGRVAMLDGDHDAALVDLAAGRLRPSDCSCCQSGTATT